MQVPSVAEEYFERADAFRQQALTSVLPRVREKCLRAAEAWEAMAEQRAEHEALQKKSGKLAVRNDRRIRSVAWPL